MKSVRIICLLAIALAAASCRTYPDIDSGVVQLSTGFKFTEGPAVSSDGDIYFTDIPNSRIHVWSPKRGLSTFRENSGRANGLLFDIDDNLLICEGGSRKVTSISPEGKKKVLADSFDGKKLNSPNDLWQDSKGGIYFTDPRYGKKDGMEQDGEHVYYIVPDGEDVICVISDMVRPNGIIGTADGKTLYVADHGGDKTFKYRVNSDGTLRDKKLLAAEGSDGMALDCRGNLYITTDAVRVYSPSGDLISVIKVPERPANVCFGKDGRTLFITARTSIYAVVVGL